MFYLSDWIGCYTYGALLANFHPDVPLHPEVKVNICIQVSSINGHNPSYMNDLLVLNSDIKRSE